MSRYTKELKIVRLSIACDVCAKSAEFTGPEDTTDKDAAEAGWRTLVDPVRIGAFDDSFVVCSRACADKQIHKSIVRTYGEP